MSYNMSKLLNASGRPVNEAQLVSPTGEALASTPPKAEPLNLTPFPDGYIYKFSPNPAKRGTFVLFTVDQVVVAVTPDPQVANVLCEAMRMLFLAHQQGVKEGSEVPEFAKQKADDGAEE